MRILINFADFQRKASIRRTCVNAQKSWETIRHRFWHEVALPLRPQPVVKLSDQVQPGAQLKRFLDHGHCKESLHDQIRKSV